MTKEELTEILTTLSLRADRKEKNAENARTTERKEFCQGMAAGIRYAVEKLSDEMSLKEEEEKTE